MILYIVKAMRCRGHAQELLEWDNHRCFGRRDMMPGGAVMRRPVGGGSGGGGANQRDERQQHGDAHETTLRRMSGPSALCGLNRSDALTRG
jgi:hypothetical protein